MLYDKFCAKINKPSEYWIFIDLRKNGLILIINAWGKQEPQTCLKIRVSLSSSIKKIIFHSENSWLSWKNNRFFCISQFFWVLMNNFIKQIGFNRRRISVYFLQIFQISIFNFQFFKVLINRRFMAFFHRLTSNFNDKNFI